MNGRGPRRFSAAPNAAYPGGKVPGGTAGSRKFAEGRRRNPVAIAALVVVALLLVVYVAGAVIFMGRFYPNTTLGNFDLSMKPFDQAVDELESAEKSYALSISGEGFSTNITAKEGGIQLDSDKVIAAAKGGMNPALWFVNMWGAHDATENLTASADSTALRNLLTEEIEEFNAGQTASEDAAIVYDAESHSYKIKPEVNGTQLDAEGVVQQAITAMLSMQDTLKLDDDVVIKPQVLSTDSRLIQGTEAANKLVACDVTLVAQLANTTEDITQINGDVISQWVTFDENYAPTFNEAVMSEWASALVASLNTVGSTRTYTRGDGKQVSVSGGDYGWAVDTSSLVSTIEDAVTNASKVKSLYRVRKRATGLRRQAWIGAPIAMLTLLSSTRAITTRRVTCFGSRALFQANLAARMRLLRAPIISKPTRVPRCCAVRRKKTASTNGNPRCNTGCRL